MANETELQRKRRLLKMSEGPLGKIRRQQALTDRLFRPDSSTMRLFERMQQPSYATPLAEHFESLNRRSALFEATQSILARPDMLEQLEALTKSADKTQRLVDSALLPNRHSLTAIAEKMAKQVDLFKTAGLAQSAWSQLLSKQMAAVQTPWLDAHLTSLSFEGFAVVSRLGQAVRYAEPFDEVAREQIDEDLGYPIEVER